MRFKSSAQRAWLVGILSTLSFLGLLHFSFANNVLAQPDKGRLSLELDKVIIEHLQEWSSEPSLIEYGRTIFIEDMAAYAIIYYSFVPSRDGLVEIRHEDAGLASIAVAVFENEKWKVWFEADEDFDSAYSNLPPRLVENIDVEQFSHSLDRSKANEILHDYRLPWSDGNRASVVRSYNEHGVGEIDFELDKDTIVAAKNGTIIYANDTHSINTGGTGPWVYWNMVIIRHDDNEYSGYAHLAHNSIPDSIKDKCSDKYEKENCAVKIQAGEMVGRQGNTGRSTGPHLHWAVGTSTALSWFADTKDEDNDGNRKELLPTRYVWDLRNVYFKGYTQAQIKGWPNNTKLIAKGQAAHSGGGINGYVGYNTSIAPEYSIRVKLIPGDYEIVARPIHGPFVTKPYSRALFELPNIPSGRYMLQAISDLGFVSEEVSVEVKGGSIERVGTLIVMDACTADRALTNCGTPGASGGEANGNYFSTAPRIGSTVVDTTYFKAWVTDPNGVDYVRFRVEPEGEGWTTVWSSDSDCSAGEVCDYEANVDISDLPDGEITIGLDFRDKDGHWLYSPSGTFVIYKNAGSAPPEIGLGTANGQAISYNGQRIYGNTADWRFEGTGNDDIDIDDIIYDIWGSSGNHDGEADGERTWVHERGKMEGHHRVSFYADDDDGNESERVWIDLYVDTAKPRSRANILGSPAGNGWYKANTQVKLVADDVGSGRSGSKKGIPHHYKAGIDVIHYQIDGGTWQTHNGSNKTLNLTGDGIHTIRYYAVDNVGNQESHKTVSVKIDATPPTAPSNGIDANGVISDQWQRDHNDPNFSWTPSTDAGSGVKAYQTYFGKRPDGIGAHRTPNAAYDPAPVTTETYYLRVRAQDHAGNYSAWQTLHIYRYDGTPPHNPEVTHEQGAISGVWQNQQRTPDFDWPTPYDAGSGLRGYYLYWGTNENGTSTDFVTGNTFVTTVPTCATDSACSYYLRLRSEDNVGWQAEWATAFVLHYDNVAPTGILTIEHGLETTDHTHVRLDIDAHDEGSGVELMRIAVEGEWGSWEPYVPVTFRQLPGIGRRTNRIHIEFADAVPNVSEMISDTIYFDTNSPQPSSNNFTIWTDNLNSGANDSSSSSYNVHSTLGQGLGSGHAVSSNYQLSSGYEGAKIAEPTVVPTYTTYMLIKQVMAAGGTGGTFMQSGDFMMQGTVAQPADTRPMNSASYSLQSGYWAGVGFTVPSEPPIEPPEPPAPVGRCGAYSVSINNNEAFTNSPVVELSLCGPDAVEIIVSDSLNFTANSWQTYTETIPYTLVAPASSVDPAFVHVRFRDTRGQVHGVFSDDIIYDVAAPAGTLVIGEDGNTPSYRVSSSGRTVQTMRSTNTVQVPIEIDAIDDSSGVGEMQCADSADFTNATWQSFEALSEHPVTQDGITTIHCRIRDEAANTSVIISDTVLVDTTPPTGRFDLVTTLVGPNTVTLTVAINAEDNLSGMDEMRIGYTPDLADGIWQSYESLLQFTNTPTNTSAVEATIYMQFRDSVGNESTIVTNTLTLDNEPPVGFVDVLDGDTITRSLVIYGWDYFGDVVEMQISSDYFMRDQVVTVPYTNTLAWDFSDTSAVYVRLIDSVGNVSERLNAVLQTSELPSATYYGIVIPATGFIPAAGQQLVAKIGDVECGSATLTTTGDDVSFSIQVKGETLSGAPNNCGADGHTITFYVDGILVSPTANWDNTSDHYLELSLPIQAPMLVSPVDSLTTNNGKPTFNWSPVSNATSYQIQAADSNTFASTVLSATVTAPTASYTAGSTLADDTYYWRVRTQDRYGLWSDWSTVWQVTIDTIAPAVPTVTTPSCNSITADTMPMFSWSASTGAAQYQLQIDDQDDFGSFVIDTTLATTSYTTTSTLDDATYYWRVRTQDTVGNWSSWSAICAFEVDSTAPAVPTIISPSCNSADNDPTPTFTWSATASAAQYQLQVDDNNDFGSILIDTTTISTTHTTSSLSDGTYYWRLRAQDIAGNWSNWSNGCTFEIDSTAPTVPLTVSPACSSAASDRTPTFSWTSIADASQYQLQVDPSASFASTLIDTTLVATSYTPSSDMVDGTYYWRLRSADRVGNWSDWSNACLFEIDSTAPAAPSLVAPTCGSVTNNVTPFFDWNVLAGVVQYQVQVADSPEFGTLAIDATTASTNHTPASNLGDSQYYWRVRGKDAVDNWSSWSSVCALEIDTASPVVPSVISPACNAQFNQLPAFDWSSATGVSGYQFQLDDASDFASPITDIITALSGYTFSGLLADGEHYWRVRARDVAENWSDWQASCQFTLDTMPPAVPTPASCDVVVETPMPTLRWDEVVDSAEYELRFSRMANFTTVLESTLQSAAEYTTLSEYEAGTYYWQVRSRDALSNWSAWSSTCSLDIEIQNNVFIPIVIKP